MTSIFLAPFSLFLILVRFYVSKLLIYYPFPHLPQSHFSYDCKRTYNILYVHKVYVFWLLLILKRIGISQTLHSLRVEAAFYNIFDLRRRIRTLIAVVIPVARTTAYKYAVCMGFEYTARLHSLIQFSEPLPVINRCNRNGQVYIQVSICHAF